MSAYFIAEMAIHDAATFDEYRRLALPTVERHAPTPIIRAQEFVMLEGGPLPKRLVVHKFDTTAAALAWYHDEEYQRAAVFRRRSAESRILLCNGVDGDRA